MRQTLRRAVAALILCAVMSASVAVGAVTIYEGRGVGKTRLGWNDRKAARSLSKRYKVTRDTSYSYTVYHWYVGKHMSNKRYPIELYAKADRKVFRYNVNSSSYVTSAGIKVGSTVSALRSAYSNEKGPYTSGSYKRYRVKRSKSYTDFYCKSGKVNFIVVAR